DRVDRAHDHAVEAGAEPGQQPGGVLEDHRGRTGVPERVAQQGEGAVGDEGGGDGEEGDEVDHDASGDHGLPPSWQSVTPGPSPPPGRPPPPGTPQKRKWLSTWLTSPVLPRSRAML